MTGGGALDVDGRIHAALGQRPVQIQLHVASSFEFLENHLVHTAARFDQRAGNHGQRAAFPQVAGGAKQTFGTVQGVGIQTAGKHFAGGWDNQVVGARQTRDGIKQDDDVFAKLHERLGAGERHFRDAFVVHGLLVESRVDDFDVVFVFTGRLDNHFLEGGDFLGALVDEQHDQVHVFVVFRIDCANISSSVVFPALGGATIMPRWPQPMGANKSTMRPA